MPAKGKIVPLEVSPNKTHHYLSPDNNLFRLLKKNENFLRSFLNFFDKHNPAILNDFELLFGIEHLLEDIELGKIINIITNDSLWKKYSKKLNNESITKLSENLDYCYSSLIVIIKSLPELEKEILLKKIDVSIGYAEKNILFGIITKETLLRFKYHIETEEYLDNFSNMIAWAILINPAFFSNSHSPSQCERQQQYYDSLLMLWINKKNTHLDLCRLLDRRLLFQTNNSKNYYTTNEKEKKELLNNIKFKEDSDLLDSRFIQDSAVGYNGLPVIGMSSAPEEQELNVIKKHEQRMSNFKDALPRLKTITNCDIKTISGEIIIIIYKGDKVLRAHRIPF